MRFWDFENIYTHLEDDESKYLFDLRLQYALDGNSSNFVKGIYQMNKNWNISERDDISPYLNRGMKIIIFGAGIYGIFTKKVLEQNGYSVFAFCDSDEKKVGIRIDAIEVLSVEEAHSIPDRFIVLASYEHWDEMFRVLGDYPDFDRNRIFIPRAGAMVATCGEQYFDCTEVSITEKDIFIDAGVYDGGTTEYVLNNYDVDGVVGFEPNQKMFEKSQKKLNSAKVRVYPYAAWNDHEELYFSSMGSGSCIDNGGVIKVIGESIDNVLDGNRASVIKMDIEGAEYKALIGAEKTIRRFHPKLMISIYHKPEDIYEIPNLILSFCSDYIFYIRHYTSYLWETVLYGNVMTNDER